MMTTPPREKRKGTKDEAVTSSASFASTMDSFGEELTKLSLEERSSALHDLHGVAEITKETPEMIREACQEMTKHLDVMSAADNGSGEDCGAYRAAVTTAPEYVEGLKPRFLRCDNYDSLAASERMILFFHRKLELFGQDLLTKEIQQRHLSQEDMEALRSGIIQLLPHRDRAGRTILMVHGATHVSFANTVTVMRVIFYFSLTVLQDMESQINGVVMFYYGLGQNIAVPGRAVEFSKQWWSIPWRFVACHYCKDKSTGVFDTPMRVLTQTLVGQALSRFRLHVGTHLETMYNLMTFGIPREAIPLDDSGQMTDLSHHLQILDLLRYREEQQQQQEQQQEVVPRVVTPAPPTVPSVTSNESADPINNGIASEPNTTIFLIPGHMDVLMGRGRHPKNRPGALKLHNLLLEHKEAHSKATKIEKPAICRQILLKMKQGGSRFLAAVPCGFVECTDEEAREKIAHGFRNLRLKDNQNKKSNNRNHKRRIE